MMDCERTDLLLGWLEDALDPDERVAVEGHLAGCAACRDALEGYRATARALASLEAPAPSETARTSAYAAMLEAMDDAASDPAPGAAPRGRLLRFAPLAGAAAAAAVLAVATMLPSRPAPGELAAAREQSAEAEAGVASAPPAAPAGARFEAASELRGEPAAPPPQVTLADAAPPTPAPDSRSPEAATRPRAELGGRAREAVERAGALEDAASDPAAGAPRAPAPELASAAQRREPLAVWRVHDEAGGRLYVLFEDGVQRGAWPAADSGAGAQAEPGAGAGGPGDLGAAGPAADEGAGSRWPRGLAEAKPEASDGDPDAPSVVLLEPSATAHLETAAVSAADPAVAGDLLAILARELAPPVRRSARLHGRHPPPAEPAGAAAPGARLRPRRPEVVLTLFAALGQRDLAPDAALPELQERLRTMREYLRLRALEAEEPAPAELERAREAPPPAPKAR